MQLEKNSCLVIVHCYVRDLGHLTDSSISESWDPDSPIELSEAFGLSKLNDECGERTRVIGADDAGETADTSRSEPKTVASQQIREIRKR